MVCVNCHENPCQWVQYGDCLLQTMEQFAEMHPLKTNNEIRKKAYKEFIQRKFGKLGHSNRQPISSCVLREIRDEYPDTGHIYMGFKEN